MKDKSVIKWLYNITEKNRINILILLIVQALLGVSSVYYATLLSHVIDNAVDKNKHGFFYIF